MRTFSLIILLNWRQTQWLLLWVWTVCLWAVCIFRTGPLTGLVQRNSAGCKCVLSCCWFSLCYSEAPQSSWVATLGPWHSTQTHRHTHCRWHNLEYDLPRQDLKRNVHIFIIFGLDSRMIQNVSNICAFICSKCTKTREKCASCMFMYGTHTHSCHFTDSHTPAGP